MGFLEDIGEDNENVFFSEFAEKTSLEFDEVIYNLLVIFDSESAKRYNAKNIYGEMSEIETVMLIEANQLDFEVAYNQSIKINGNYYTVEKVEIDLGVYSIYLSKNLS